MKKTPIRAGDKFKRADGVVVEVARTLPGGLVEVFYDCMYGRTQRANLEAMERLS